MMVGIALLLILLRAADASPTQTSCCKEHRVLKRREHHFHPIKSSAVAFQNHDNHLCRGGISNRRRNGSRVICIHDSLDDREIPIQSTTHFTRDFIHTTPHQSDTEVSRRTALLQILSFSILSSSLPDTSYASEIDISGELYSPKNEMIKGGGSAAARGIKLKPMDERESRSRKNQSLLKSTGLIQNVYETRFITYLSRFLLTYDSAANAWWKKNSKPKAKAGDDDIPIGSTAKDGIAQQTFAEFAESVEIGLADYFLGPYGSYASVAAAKAGIAAQQPAKSVRESETGLSLWSIITGRNKSTKQTTTSAIAKRKSRNAEKEATNLARQGILNLLSLLRARYTSIEEKQQLALLFSMISKPELQPVQEIRGLLGEVDNGTIAAVELVDLSLDDEEDASSAREYFRLSSRQGGGFSKNDEEVVRVEPPAPLGDEYKPAKIRAVMKPTTRVLRIDVIDGGSGYSVAPDVIVKQRGVSRQCDATAIIDREGRVSEIVVLNPGFGYGGQQARRGQEPVLPTVEIRERKLRQKISQKEVKPAKAVAELEYKVR